MKKMYFALLVSATFVMVVSGCNKSLDTAAPLQNTLSQSAKERILSSENGIATVTSITTGDNVTLTLRPANLNGQDAMILRYDPDTSYVNLNRGQEIDIPALTWTAGGIPTYRRSLICFNQLSFIPSNATIVSAKLYLYGLPQGGSPNCPQGNSSGSGFDNNTSWLKRCVSGWNENTVTWNNQPMTVNTNQATIPTTGSQWNQDETISIQPFVAYWVLNPSQNFGMMMSLKTEIQYRSITFGSSENSTNYRPKLVVVYHI